jgi:cytochrome c oxidase subunit 3
MTTPADLHEHPPFLQHHFDTAPQQFEASKLGMWLFVATEVLLFGGLFCGYAVYRGNHPDVFHYGSGFLDTTWGAINTVVLILSSVTMAIGVTAAQRDHRAVLVACLALTFGGGAIFMGVKYVEYSHKFHENLVPGTRFYEDPHPGAHAAETAPGAGEAVAGDAARGRVVWTTTCRSCHGEGGEGIAGQGKDIRGSEFIAQRSDGELLAFVKVGRMPFDPLNTTGVQMPPKGGNPLLKDHDLLDAIAFLRTIAAAAIGGGQVPAPAEEAAFWIPRSSIPDAPAGPAGIAVARLEGSAPESIGRPVPPSRDPDRPRNAHMFFVFYFLMTGLHGLHVLAGMAVMAWLLVRALLGHFGAAYFTPVDLGGLYWHVVDLIWIFLFPLFYLIR